MRDIKVPNLCTDDAHVDNLLNDGECHCGEVVVWADDDMLAVQHRDSTWADEPVLDYAYGGVADSPWFSRTGR